MIQPHSIQSGPLRLKKICPSIAIGSDFHAKTRETDKSVDNFCYSGTEEQSPKLDSEYKIAIIKTFNVSALIKLATTNISEVAGRILKG